MKANLDPKSVNARLYGQISDLLDDLEDGEKVTLRERIAALIAIARIQAVFVALRKEKISDDALAGSKVRKYSSTFKAHDARGRKTGTGPVEPEPDDGIEDIINGDDDGDDDAS